VAVGRANKIITNWGLSMFWNPSWIASPAAPKTLVSGNPYALVERCVVKMREIAKMMEVIPVDWNLMVAIVCGSSPSSSSAEVAKA
jgi:hypothetical protein